MRHSDVITDRIVYGKCVKRVNLIQGCTLIKTTIVIVQIKNEGVDSRICDIRVT